MKGKIGRIIFRKINGRIIPIRISNIADPIATASSQTAKFRKIIAESPKKERLGTMFLEIPNKGKTAHVSMVEVAKPYRRKGISKNLFARAAQSLERYGFKFLRTGDLQHPAQVKIRRKLGGTYKAGGKRKSRTRFFADQFGRYGEESRRVTSQEAKDILKNNTSGRQVKATTMLKKYMGRKKK
jgi:hypothetical protein